MAARITIVSARFEDLVSIGLASLISEDPNLELLADGVDLERLEPVLTEQKPSVVLLNFGTLPNPAMIYQLHQAHPETRIVVLANKPTAAECNQMLSFGATACISKETQGRDIINARPPRIARHARDAALGDRHRRPGGPLRPPRPRPAHPARGGRARAAPAAG